MWATRVVRAVRIQRPEPSVWTSIYRPRDERPRRDCGSPHVPKPHGLAQEASTNFIMKAMSRFFASGIAVALVVTVGRGRRGVYGGTGVEMPGVVDREAGPEAQCYADSAQPVI